MRSTRLPTYYLSHGGGPWPWMKDQAGTTFDKLEAGLLDVRAELADVPKAVLVISGHWETPQFEEWSLDMPSARRGSCNGRRRRRPAWSIRAKTTCCL